MLECLGATPERLAASRPPRLGYRQPRPQPAEPCPGTGRSQGLSSVLHTKSLSCLRSHPFPWPPALLALSPPPLAGHSAVPFPRLRELRPSLSTPLPLPASGLEDQAGPDGVLAPRGSPQPRPHSRVPSKRVAIVSRKVFCGASNPFMTGMARGGSWRRGAEGGQLGRAPGGALPAGPGRPMRGPASYPPSHRRRLCSKPLGFRLGGAPPRRLFSPRARFFPPGSAASATWPRTGRGHP